MDQTTEEMLESAAELLRAGRPEKARALLADLLTQDPNSERAWLMLSFAVTDRAEQIHALEQVLRINPGNRVARSQLLKVSRAGVSTMPAPAKPANKPVTSAPIEDRKPPSTFLRVTRYVAVRAVTLGLMVAIGVFLAIVVINYGGYIDKIFEAQIDESLMFLGLSMRGATPEELVQAT